MKIIVFTIAFEFWLLSSNSAHPLLSEIYCNVSGSDTENSFLEFVELYNPEPLAFDLTEYRLIDLADTNDYLIPFFAGGRTLARSGEYIVIVDPDYPGVENPLGIPDTVVWLTIGNDHTIGNGLKSADECLWWKHSEQTIDSFCWAEDPGDGVSWERQFDETGIPGNQWALCHDPKGHSVGRANSAPMIPPSSAVSIRWQTTILSYQRNWWICAEWHGIGQRSLLRYGILDLQGFFLGWIDPGSVVAGAAFIEWNGILSGYTHLKPGTYILHLELKGETDGSIQRINQEIGIIP